MKCSVYWVIIGCGVPSSSLLCVYVNVVVDFLIFSVCECAYIARLMSEPHWGGRYTMQRHIMYECLKDPTSVSVCVVQHVHSHSRSNALASARGIATTDRSAAKELGNRLRYMCVLCVCVQAISSCAFFRRPASTFDACMYLWLHFSDTHSQCVWMRLYCVVCIYMYVCCVWRAAMQPIEQKRNVIEII